MTDCPVAGDRHQRRWFNAPHSSTSSPSFLMTDSIVNVTHHRFVSDLQPVKKSSSSSVSSSHSAPEVKHPLSSVCSKSASASDRRCPRPGTSETAADRREALDLLWQATGNSPSKGDDGQKTPPSEVTSDVEKQASPSVIRGSGRQKQTKEAGDAGGAEGGGGSGGQETSYSSCLEGSGSTSSQVTWFSVTDCSLSATDQEKKRVSFGDSHVPCPDPDKRNSLQHKRSILKAATAAPLADGSTGEAGVGDEGGGEGKDVERSGGGRHGSWSERDLEVDKIVNSAALTKKRLRKRSTNSSPSQLRQSQVLLILSGRFSTPRRNQSVGGVPTKEADKVGGRRKSEQPAAASGCGPGHPTDVHLSGSRRGHRPQTPPPQRRRRCQSSGGVINESYKEDEGDREEGEEGDNRRNAERLQEGGGGGEGAGQEEGEGGGGKGGLKLSSSTCYLVHLRDMDRIPKHVEHIIRKFNLHLLEPQNITCHNNSIDVESASPTMTERATMKQHQQQQQQSLSASISSKKNESEEKVQNSISSSCLEQEASKTRSLSLRRRLSLRFSKKTGSLDKSKSVPGPSTIGQGGGGGGGSSREETAAGPLGGSMKGSTTSGVEESKDTSESCGAAGNSEDQMKNSEAVAVMSDATHRMQKKAPRWRKLSLHIFRRSRDRVTKEAEQHPHLQQEEEREDESKEREESSDALDSRDKTDGNWKGQPPPPPPLPATAETAEGTTTVGPLLSNAKRTSSETRSSKVLISDPQLTYQDPATDVDATMVRPAETRTQGKTESNRELTLQQRPTSQSPWKTTKTVTQTSSSDVIIVPLVAKTSQVFQDAVFYFPSQDNDDDDDDGRGARDGLKGGLTAAGVAKSEGKVPQPSKSSSLRLPLKGAISETRDEVELRQRRQRSPRRLERRRSSFLLRRIRAFFGRSSGSAEDQSTEEEEGRMTKDEEQLMMRQDVEMEVPQGRTSSSLLPKHPTAPAPPPHQLKDSIPLLHAESFDPPPHPPPPPPHKHSSSTTFNYARRQSSSENQLPLSGNRRSVSPFVGEGQQQSGKEEEEKRGRRRGREDESVER